ncbi:hypothetical protein BDV27DRAFT_120560 [Aspergillus caelatus]|uniref:Uncharacterized protein n=1 Tax=Aspergillus caelatus TaxID=61420 RepID=A0A5N7AK67_9EURO|nr:uncharacterized protein BDV27DRAFT_120560 [Aspergillus caelatus]KAE8369596.1 hypothetical protein BDV27DRAFT_120560 [Aspergillus caelatus]
MRHSMNQILGQVSFAFQVFSLFTFFFYFPPTLLRTLSVLRCSNCGLSTEARSRCALAAQQR